MKRPFCPVERLPVTGRFLLEVDHVLVLGEPPPLQLNAMSPAAEPLRQCLVVSRSSSRRAA